MKIFLIKNNDFVCFDYDAYSGHVIVASNENDVRELAKKCSADEGRDVWEKATVTEEGIYTGTKTEPFILLSDFNAG